MSKILSETRTPVYNSQGQLTGHLVETLRTIDPPGTAPVQPLRTNAQTCLQCQQASSSCRCRTSPAKAARQQPQSTASATREDDAAWRPPSILHANAKDQAAASPPMTPEERALRIAQASWWALYNMCASHPNCLVFDAELKACTAEQLTRLYAELQSGTVIEHWYDEALRAWAPKGLQSQYPSKP